jgi:hypothetical protein
MRASPLRKPSARRKGAPGTAIDDPGERAEVETKARLLATRIVDDRWLDVSRIALRLERCRRLSGDEVRELLATPRRAA